MSIRALPMLRNFVGSIRRAISWAWRGETHRTFFDPFNPRELGPVLARCGVAPLVVEPTQAERGKDEAARFVLALYANSPRLRCRFPLAFSPDAAGCFLEYLREKREHIGLSNTGLQNTEVVFASSYGSRPARIWEAHADLRAELPFALTPFQRGKFLAWLLLDAKARYQLSDAECLWHIFELAADPSAGLERTYRWTPRWQAEVPDALADTGWSKLKDYIAKELGFASRWLRRARRHGADSDQIRASKSINLLGYFRYTSGLQQVVLTMRDAFQSAGMSLNCRDVPTPYIRERSAHERFDGLEAADTTIVNMPIDLRRDETYARAGLHVRPGVRRIAVAWWELEQVPPAFANWAGDFDEIWAPTRFIQNAIQQVTSKSVRVMLPGLELPKFDRLPKQHFGLDPHKFTFLFVFDFNSRMQRKNPLGLIEAFRLAFRRGEAVELVLKVSSGDSVFREQKNVLCAAAERHGVSIIDSMLSRGELLALTNCCDCYVSLHRAEGFGLTIAEAMLLGKPAIATGYSGNLDFMTSQNSLLVNFKKVPITDDVPPYPRGTLWAEPSVEHAADLMRWMYEHPQQSKELGDIGRADLRRLLSIDEYGRRLVAALDQ